MRGIGATTPMFLPATKHLARFPVFVAIVAVFTVAFAGLTLAFALDAGTGWGWTVAMGATTVVFGWFVVAPFRMGVVLDEGRIGLRHPLRPGMVWVDLDRVDLAVPASTSVRVSEVPVAAASGIAGRPATTSR